MSSLERILKETKQRRAVDKERFENINKDLCQICWAFGADKRSLFIDCWYVLSEAVEEIIDIHDCGLDSHKEGWYLRVCKTCRAQFIGMLRQWAVEGRERRALSKNHDGCVEGDMDRNIPVQIDGARVMMNAEEYEEYISATEEPQK